MTRVRLLAASLCAAILSFGFVARSSHAQTKDATTGGPAVTSPATALPTNTHSTCNALWDLTPGVYASYEPSGRFSQLVADLAKNGTFVSTTTAGLDSIDLAPYDVLVVSVGSAWDRAYTPSEVAAIRAFQTGGGGLLVLADNANTPNGNINPVTVPLGTTCGLSLLLPLDLFVSNFTAHPIFTGVHQLYMRAAGDLGVALPSVAAALDPSGAPVISVVESHRSVVTGDINILDNDYIGIADNRTFGVNVFNWLCQATPTNRPPDCSRAVACEPVPWPPNHAFHAVSICGVTDPDSGDVVTITVTSVTQDEPTNTRGDSNTCPDAQIVSGQVSVRAERTGTPSVPGNGRVYAIGFTADDGHGGQCTDTVYVCVPHDQGDPTCINDGQRYNSLGSCRGGNPLGVEQASLAIGDVSNGQAHLTFALPVDGPVEIAAFDVAGRRLATIVSEVLASGVYERDWNMGGIPKGLYFVRVQAGGVKLTRTVTKLQ